MKRILFIFFNSLIILLSFPCFAGRVQQAHKAVIAAKNWACTPTEVGTELTCDDSIDNDCDGDIDDADSDCTAACADSSCSGFVTCQNGEDTGYDNSETWTEQVYGSALVNEDYTTLALRGTQSIRLYGGSDGIAIVSKSVGDQGDLWLHLRFRPHVIEEGYPLLKLFDSGANELLSLKFYSNTIRMAHGSTIANDSGAMSVDTTYDLWVHYVKGTGANGVATFYRDIDQTIPVSANISITTGTSTANVATKSFYAYYNSDFLIDQILADESAIGDVCE